MSLYSEKQVEGAVQQWVDSFMTENNILASSMENALSKVLLTIKDKVFIELFLEAQTKENNEEVDE